MGHCREGAPSNSNLLAALHSDLEEQAYEVLGPQMALQASSSLHSYRAGLGGEGSMQHRDHSGNAHAQMGPEPSREAPSWSRYRRGAYFFTASIVVLILAFLVNWWLA